MTRWRCCLRRCGGELVTAEVAVMGSTALQSPGAAGWKSIAIVPRVTDGKAGVKGVLPDRVASRHGDADATKHAALGRWNWFFVHDPFPCVINYGDNGLGT